MCTSYAAVAPLQRRNEAQTTLFVTWDLVARFFIGGVAVTMFALAGDLFEPKTFAGIFGAAPSVALATLALTYGKQSHRYVAEEGRAMIAGGVALGLYSLALVVLLARRRRASAWSSAVMLWLVWGAVAFVLEAGAAP